MSFCYYYYYSVVCLIRLTTKEEENEDNDKVTFMYLMDDNHPHVLPSPKVKRRQFQFFDPKANQSSSSAHSNVPAVSTSSLPSQPLTRKPPSVPATSMPPQPIEFNHLLSSGHSARVSREPKYAKYCIAEGIIRILCANMYITQCRFKYKSSLIVQCLILSLHVSQPVSYFMKSHIVLFAPIAASPSRDLQHSRYFPLVMARPLRSLPPSLRHQVRFLSTQLRSQCPLVLDPSPMFQQQ